MSRLIPLLLVLTVSVAAGCAATPTTDSTPPPDTLTEGERRPHPDDVLVFHEVEFEAALPRDRLVAAFLAEKLETFIHGTDKLPGCVGTDPLTEARFPTPGSVRLVKLADGNTAHEEVLEVDGEHLRYLVNHYTSAAAGPIRYGIGEFHFTPAGEHTHVRWRYSFALREDEFPGELGGLGRVLFRWFFLDGDYADFMNKVAADIAAWAEHVAR